MPGTQETLRKQQLLTLMVVDIPALLSVYKDPGALFLCVCVCLHVHTSLFVHMHVCKCVCCVCACVHTGQKKTAGLISPQMSSISFVERGSLLTLRPSD